jgi:aldose 1-epimerase
MNVLELKSADSASTASISVDRGFNCFAFRADVDGRFIDVIDSQPGFQDGEGRESGNGIPLLFPFPNRIRAGRYSWAGRDYELPDNLVSYDNTGNAIHGFCLDRPWRVVASGPDFAVGEFHLSRDAPDRRELWPADFVIRCRYEVAGSGLRSRFEITNPDTVALPWGLGTHAYFRLPLSADSRADQCLLVAPPTTQYELIDCLPTGGKSQLPDEFDLHDGIRFGTRKLDDVFGGVPADLVESCMMDESAGLQVVQRNPGSFRDLVIYTPPDRDAVCFEPYTCITDAVNLQQRGVDAGWRTLGPGESFSTWINIEAGPIIV